MNSATVYTIIFCIINIIGWSLILGGIFPINILRRAFAASFFDGIGCIAFGVLVVAFLYNMLLGLRRSD
jgi:hypothetical protein